jgi:nucleoside-diphosphate-sugar epimerase
MFSAMRTLVIGGTTFVGRRIVELFLDGGAHVTVLSRGRRRPPFWPRIEHLAADRTIPGELGAHLRGRTFDVVVDMVAFEGTHVETVLSVLRGGIGRYVLMSSGAVYPDLEPPATFRPLAEGDANLALRGDLPYAEGKRACEQVLGAQAGVPYTVFRPPIIQGPHDPTLRGWFWIQRVADGGPVLVPQRYPAVVWRQAYSGDVARAVVAAAGHPRARKATYNVAMPEVVALEDFVRLVAAALDRPDPVVAVPEPRLRDAAPWYRPTFARQFLLDIAAIQHDLDLPWTPIDRWVTETVRWHLQAGLPPSRGYERRGEEIRLARTWSG